MEGEVDKGHIAAGSFCVQDSKAKKLMQGSLCRTVNYQDMGTDVRTIFWINGLLYISFFFYFPLHGSSLYPSQVCHNLKSIPICGHAAVTGV